MNDPTFCTLSEFAAATGISRPTLNKLRKSGVLPWFGSNPVRIPYEAAIAALLSYAERTAAAAAEEGGEPHA